MKYFVLPLLIFASIFSFYACEKDSADPIPEIPSDTTVTFLPTFISFSDELNPENGVAVSIKYDLPNRKIEVYNDDSLTANPYDRLKDVYYYTEKGYLSKWESFNENSVRIQSLIPERDNNDILKRVFLETSSIAKKDTVTITFADSSGSGSSYKIMRMEYTYRDRATATPTPIFDEYTFLGDRFISAKGGQFPVANGEINMAHANYSYDPADKTLTGMSASNTYGQTLNVNYRYQPGTGLDSFYHMLRGKDGFYLSTYFRWPIMGKLTLYYSTLNLSLYYNDYQKYTEVEVHKSGILREVEVVNDNTTINFQNTTDSSHRISESRISENGILRNIWKVRY